MESIGRSDTKRRTKKGSCNELETNLKGKKRSLKEKQNGPKVRH